MNSVLTKIKRLIIQGKYDFTAKADAERIADHLAQEDVIEAILNNHEPNSLSLVWLTSHSEEKGKIQAQYQGRNYYDSNG